ncbi:MAG TPA: UDP-N-acetylmuramate--L-alanine ligase, partial [Actinopolymorphaceae bacterium]
AAELGHLHLVGIGGVAMSAIARTAFERGIPVTGSETQESSTVQALRDLGIVCWSEHRASNIDGADTVVVSTATPADNVEVAEARRRGVRVIHRATATAALLDGYRAVAVAGAHGKTGSCAMLVTALGHAGLDPSFIVGGVLLDTGKNAHAGTGDIFVVEADESDGAFLQMSPSIAMVTNVDPDHLENYGDDANAYHAAFDVFAGHLVPGGVLVACADDPGSLALARRVAATGRRVVTYGEAPAADVQSVGLELAELSSTFRLLGTDAGGAKVPMGAVTLSAPGRHIALNATGVVAVLLELGLDAAAACAGVSAYGGTRRRFEFKGEAGGVRVFDDYGHHPTEMTATLITARHAAGTGRVVVLYRPLRHTRTQRMGPELARALELADAVVVLDPSGDAKIDGVDGTLVSDHVHLPAGEVVYEPDLAAGPARVAELVRPGDLVVTLGAGDVAAAGPALLALLAARTGTGTGTGTDTGTGTEIGTETDAETGVQA